MTKKSIVDEKILEKCRSFHNDITIDLVNEEICLCIRNFKKISIPLNEKNLIKILTSFPKDIYDLPSLENSSCFSCCRLCINRTNNKINDKVKLIRMYR